MRETSGIKIFRLVVMLTLILGNLLHLLFTCWLTVEQIETGLGYGTEIELFAIVIWGFEFLLIPLFILSIYYFIYCLLKEVEKKKMILNLILFFLLVIQIFITNLFIHI